ncbi:MAG: tyrosine-type recombinase/integrase [Promethearchaeota archaeon]
MPKKNLMSFNKGEKEIGEVFKKFQKYNESRNLADRTIGYYKECFDKFKRYLVENNIKKMNKINKELVDNYRYKLTQQIGDSTSINTYLRGLRVFLKYSIEMGYMDNFTVKMLKEEEKIKETYTDKELEILLEKPNLKECGFAEYRNWVIINWLLATGNRSRTIRNVKIKDLDFENGYIKLRKTKNRNQQIIPMSNKLNNILNEYLQFRDGDNEDYLFSTIYGKKMSSSAIISAIRRYNSRRGIEKTSIHLFRHTFAKKWILNGGDMFRLQKILGHKSTEIVKRYVNMFGEDLKNKFEDFNPINEFIEDKKRIKMDD